MKIKTQEQLDKYLKENQKKINNPKTSFQELITIMREQNEILKIYIIFKCEEIQNAE